MTNEAVSNIGMLKDGAVLKVDFLKIIAVAILGQYQNFL